MQRDSSKPGPFKPSRKWREQQEGSEEPVVRVGVPERPSYAMKSRQPGLDAITGVQKPELPEVEAEWGMDLVQRRPMPWGWFILLGILIGGVATWSFTLIMDTEPELEVSREQALLFMDADRQSEMDARELLHRIETAVFEFAASDDLDSRLAVARHPDRVKALMQNHYARHELEPLGEVEIVGMYPLTFGRFGGFWMIRLEQPDGTRRVMIVEAEEAEEAKVDWETFVNYQPMAWDDFARERPEGIALDFRVYVEQTPFRSHEFTDERVWDAYKLTAMNSEEVLYGYVRADSPSAELLRQWFHLRPDSRAMMVLNLVVPEGVESPRGVVIDHAKSARWIYVLPPYAE